MKKIALLFLSFSGMFSSLYAQKTINDPNAEKRSVSPFHGIEVATGIKLILTQGTTEDVAVSAAKTEHRNKIVTKVENGILKIHYETKLGAVNKPKETKDLKAYVSCKTLDYLNVTTGAEAEINGTISSSSFELKGSTGGQVNGKVEFGSLNVDLSTGSKITLTGKADKLEISGDTGSKFIGEDLNAGTCYVNVSTGAGVFVTVDKEVNVKANTGGYLKYKGNAGIRDIKTNTGGTVSKI